MNRHAVINVQNVKKKYFEESVLARYIQRQNNHDLWAWDFTPEVRARDNLNFQLDFPVRIFHMRVFERKNGEVFIWSGYGEG